MRSSNQCGPQLLGGALLLTWREGLSSLPLGVQQWHSRHKSDDGIGFAEGGTTSFMLLKIFNTINEVDPPTAKPIPEISMIPQHSSEQMQTHLLASEQIMGLAVFKHMVIRELGASSRKSLC